MGDLIKALQIFLKYGDPRNPFCASHDEVIVCEIDPDAVSDEDKSTLDSLGFFVSNDPERCFKLFRYGSC